jgi:hypothetical protein
VIVCVSKTTADSDAFPRMGLQCIRDDRFHVIGSIQADEAGLHAHATFGELGQSRLDRLGDRLRIPRPGYSIRIKPDDKDAG